MEQRQRNLFFFYRGARPRGTAGDLVLERQLEDNSTKALVNVLEHSDREVVLKPFLKKIAGVRLQVPPDSVQFALQRVDIGRPQVRRRVALSIAPDPGLDRRRHRKHEFGRPDAWIWADGAFSILIETKVQGRAGLHQVRRHVHGATGWRRGNYLIRPRSWGDVYEFFERVRLRRFRLDPVTRLLVEEFTRYLKMTRLSSSTTFDLEDFGFFMLSPKERSGRSFLKRKLLGFTTELSATRGMKRIMREYAGRSVKPAKLVHPGVFRKDASNFWITIGAKRRRHRCHFTVRISERGIALEAFSPHRSFTRRLVEKIRTQPQEFVDTLNAMDGDKPYFIRLREAYYKDPDSPYKGQRIGRVRDFMVMHPGVITADNVNQLLVHPVKERLERSNLRPEVFVIRQFDLSELIGQRDVVERVAEAAERMLPYLSFALNLD